MRLIQLTNFTGSGRSRRPQRVTINPEHIVNTVAFGRGRDSGVEVEFTTGTVLKLSIWDTHWFTMLSMFSDNIDPIFIWDPYNNPAQQAQLDADMLANYGIQPPSRDGVEESSPRTTRNTRSGRTRRPAENVGERGTPCAMCETEHDKDALLDVTDEDGETMLVCEQCASEINEDLVAAALAAAEASDV